LFNKNFFLILALSVAICVEHTGLHEKLALKLIIIFGTDPKWLLLSTMSVTAFMSCWMKNTAVTSMMLPIVEGLVHQIAKFNKVYSHENGIDKSNPDNGGGDHIQLSILTGSNLDQKMK
jgi:sodium-dependent dicarboxylate transporter 2/3/5